MTGERLEKLPFRVKAAFECGSIAYNILGNGIGMLALPIYNVGLGVSASLIGLALGLPRIWDAINDPLMGHISDNTRTRWGRRRPYILVGGILSGAVFALLWNPNPGWSKGQLLAFFAIVTMLYYTVLSIWATPYEALGLELTYDYRERTSLQAYRTFAAMFFGLTLPWIYRMCFWNWDILFRSEAGSLGARLSALLRGTKAHGAEVSGAGIVGIVFGALIAVTAVVPVLCKERAETQSQDKMPFLKAFRSTFGNRPYLILTAVSFLTFFGIFLVQPLGLYLNIFYIFGGDRAAAATMSGIAGTFYTAMGTISIPFTSCIAAWLDKKRTLLLSLLLTTVGYVSIWWLYTPANPWLQFIPLVLIGPAWNICTVIMPSMVADVCDLDELKTGLRREGMYGAIGGLIMKMGVGLVTCVTGVIVSLAGVDPEAAKQSAETIIRMRAMFVGIPSVLLAISTYIAYHYPITEAKAREVRSILDTARAEKKEEQVVTP
ncbi:MAG: MFS transporter [Armatimonadota bacterium]